jgi:membrane protein implicated in regulation of membrane protease activity
MLILLLGAAALLAVAGVLFFALRDAAGQPSSAAVPGRTEKLAGQRGVVTEVIDPLRGTGRITVGGQDWAATASATVPLGVEVTVDGSDGIVLHVSPR